MDGLVMGTGAELPADRLVGAMGVPCIDEEVASIREGYQDGIAIPALRPDFVCGVPVRLCQADGGDLETILLLRLRMTEDRAGRQGVQRVVRWLPDDVERVALGPA